MCVLYSTIALASLHITVVLYITIVILSRHCGTVLLYFSITLPHVVLLHSVTSLQYKGTRLGGEQSPSCLPNHYFTITLHNPLAHLQPDHQ